MTVLILFFTAPRVNDACQQLLVKQLGVKQLRVEQLLVCSQKNETARITGEADSSSFIFCVEQLKFLKKCRPIVCQAFGIRAVDMLPSKTTLAKILSQVWELVQH
jgi:hypothetical protein